MTRSWPLTNTPSLGGSLVPNAGGFIAVNDDADLMFFFDSTGQQVWSWAADGTLTDISSTTFTGTDEQILDICWFDGNLYVIYIYNASDEGKVARWNGIGETTWTDVWTITDGSNPGQLPAGAFYEYLDADDDRMVLSAHFVAGLGGPVQLAASTDGSTFAMQTLGGSDVYQSGFLVYGNSKGSGYSEMICDRSSTTTPILHSAGNDWTLANEAEPALSLAGYAAGYSLFVYNDSGTYRIVRSTDWGETITDENGNLLDTGIEDTSTGGNPQTSIRTILIPAEDPEEAPIEVIMACTRVDNQAYTWDPFTLTFVEDGLTSSGGHDHTILAFFRLGDNLYALCLSDATGEAKIYGVPINPPGYKSVEGDGVRLIDITADNRYFYMTANADGILRAYAYRLSNRHFVKEWDFGAATFAEIDARTYALWATVQPGADKILYLYGRDGSNVQIQRNDLNAGTGWVNKDDGGWASDKVAIALLPDPLEPKNILACFSDDDIYHTSEPDTAWTKIADAPTTLRAAARHRPDDRRHVMLAADSDDTIYFSHNLGLTTFDASAGALDTINVIEVSY